MKNDAPIDSARMIANRYRLGQSLGKGTFGEVFLAEDIKFKPPREVAIKILRTEYVSDPQICEDITREAGVLARFDHPNILPVLDFDVSSNTAFIVTKYASGGTLAQKIRPDNAKPPVPVPLNEIAKYLQQIAEGLDEAHTHGLIHRDIKPGNILLDSRGQVMLADFGLAAAVGSTNNPTSVMVETKPSGTPHYMAPEQWAGHSGKASDIYALGVLLYQMITGQTPYQGNISALMTQHMHSPIPKISERAIRLRYPTALDDLIGRVMDKDPQKRIKPAIELYNRFKEIIDRFNVVTPRATKALVMPSRALPSQHTKVLNSTPPQARLDAPTPPPAPKIPIPSQLFTLNGHTGHVFTIAWSPDSQYLVSGSRDNTVRLWNREGKELKVLNGHTAVVWNVAWSPDGARFASASSDNTIRIWSKEGNLQSVLKRHQGFVQWVAWSPDSKRLASVAGDRTVRLWDSDGKEIMTLYGHSAGATRVVWSPDGELLASSSDDKTVRLWSKEGNIEGVLAGHYSMVTAAAWSPDSSRLISASGDNTLRLWTKESMALRSLQGHTNAVRDVVWSPNGKMIASASADHTLRLWTADGDMLAILNGHSSRVTSVAWSPDSNTLLSGSDDSTLKLWNIEGKGLATLRCHSGFVYAVAWSPDGKALASCASDMTVQMWQVES
jgi:WD40 repeat protein/predicted Ser/Thr protein kinase